MNKPVSASSSTDSGNRAAVQTDLGGHITESDADEAKDTGDRTRGGLIERVAALDGSSVARVGDGPSNSGGSKGSGDEDSELGEHLGAFELGCFCKVGEVLLRSTRLGSWRDWRLAFIPHVGQ